MKTFEEALATRRVKSESQAREAASDIASRYVSLVAEIANSRTAMSLVASNVEAMEDMPEEDRALSLAMTMFINGVMIGIEMEKTE